MPKNDRFMEFGNILAQFAAWCPMLIDVSTPLNCCQTVKTYFGAAVFSRIQTFSIFPRSHYPATFFMSDILRVYQALQKGWQRIGTYRISTGALTNGSIEPERPELIN